MIGAAQTHCIISTLQWLPLPHTNRPRSPVSAISVVAPSRRFELLIRDRSSGLRRKQTWSLRVESAASSSKKPPPKPATRTAIVASIVVPLLLAAAAVITGKRLISKIEAEAMEEAEELERRYNPARLLTDGKCQDEENTDKAEHVERVNVVGTRNRPQREE